METKTISLFTLHPLLTYFFGTSLVVVGGRVVNDVTVKTKTVTS